MNYRNQNQASRFTIINNRVMIYTHNGQLVEFQPRFDLKAVVGNILNVMDSGHYAWDTNKAIKQQQKNELRLALYRSMVASKNTIFPVKTDSDYLHLCLKGVSFALVTFLTLYVENVENETEQTVNDESTVSNSISPFTVIRIETAQRLMDMLLYACVNNLLNLKESYQMSEPKFTIVGIMQLCQALACHANMMKEEQWAPLYIKFDLIEELDPILLETFQIALPNALRRLSWVDRKITKVNNDGSEGSLVIFDSLFKVKVEQTEENIISMETVMNPEIDNHEFNAQSNNKSEVENEEGLNVVPLISTLD